MGVRFDDSQIVAERTLDALGKRDNRGVTKKRIGPDGLGGDADPNRALRRLGATTAARERRVAGGWGQSPPTGRCLAVHGSASRPPGPAVSRRACVALTRLA